MSRGLTCSQANKKFLNERCDSNMSFVQKEGSKIVLVDEADESIIDCGWNDVIGKRFPNFGYAISEEEF